MNSLYKPRGHKIATSNVPLTGTKLCECGCGTHGYPKSCTVTVIINEHRIVIRTLGVQYHTYLVAITDRCKYSDYDVKVTTEEFLRIRDKIENYIEGGKR